MTFSQAYHDWKAAQAAPVAEPAQALKDAGTEPADSKPQQSSPQTSANVAVAPALRIPVDSGIQVLAALLEELLAEAKRSNSTSREGAVSSIAIEDAAKGPPRIHTKHYQGSPLSHADLVQALDDHGFLVREAEQLALNGWAETGDALERVREAAGK